MDITDKWLERHAKEKEYKTYSQLKDEILADKGIWIDETVFSTSNTEYQELARSLGAQIGNNLCIFSNTDDAILFKHSLPTK